MHTSLSHFQVIKGNVCVVCKVAMKNEEQFYTHAQQHGFQVSKANLPALLVCTGLIFV